MSVSTFTNIFTKNVIDYILQLPQVIEAKDNLTNIYSGKVQFSIPLTDEIRSTLLTNLGLDISSVSEIPMRWIKGDSEPHIDTGKSKFQHTYLIYLTSSPGKFIVDNVEYPIIENTGYVFNEGLSHKTIGTNIEPRLLIGPMSELGFSVGSGVYYYLTQADALGAGPNYLAFNSFDPPAWTVGDLSGGSGDLQGYTSWRIASNSSPGGSSQSLVYNNGDTLLPYFNYYLYPNNPCFLEGSQILCSINDKDVYINVENLTPGTLVKTSTNEYKKVELIGNGTIYNPGNDERIQNRLYKCSPTSYPELNTDLFITGCHSILVDSLTDKQREDTISHLGRIFVTANKYRLISCIDERASPWNSEGTYEIWHFALENDDYLKNYGVYANGLLVETCSKKYMIESSNLRINRK
jgi:hypothetical protein